MQISSRSEDFLIDTLILRDELFILNNIFTNPKLVKVDYS
jgi:exosome complex exonuclease RRP6